MNDCCASDKEMKPVNESIGFHGKINETMGKSLLYYRGVYTEKANIKQSAKLRKLNSNGMIIEKVEIPSCLHAEKGPLV